MGTDEHDVLTLLDGDLEPEEQEGPAVTDKLLEVTKSRVRVKTPELKLRDRMSK